MAAQIFLPRLAERAVEEALADTPVVLVHGPRQCGKTTLTKRVGGRLGYEYFTLDEDAVRTAASTVHPADFRGLRRLRDAAGRRFRCGVVLYDGDVTVGFGDGLFAVPVCELWS